MMGKKIDNGELKENFKRPKLCSISKSAFVSQYVLDKDKGVPYACYRFFLNLGFTPDQFDLENFLATENYIKDGSGDRFICIHGLKDFRYNLKNDVYDVDFFVGDKKVFLIIRTKEDLQQEIAEKLFKFVEMKE